MLRLAALAITTLFVAPPIIAQLEHATSAPDPRFGTVSLRNGIRMHYAEQGVPGGPVVIMLHGYTDSWYSFRRLMPLLPDSWRVIALDQRGHGRSDQPAAGYDMRTMAEDVLAFMDARMIPRATIVGHSMGSMVGQQVAALAPARVTRLVLIGSAVSGERVTGIEEFAAAVNALTDPVDAAFARGFQESTVMVPVPQDFLDTMIAGSARVPARLWKALLDGQRTNPAVDSLSLRRVRTLIVWGERDAVFGRAAQDELRRLLPRAAFTAMAETGHAPHWERPGDVAAMLRGFIP